MRKRYGLFVLWLVIAAVFMTAGCSHDAGGTSEETGTEESSSEGDGTGDTAEPGESAGETGTGETDTRVTLTFDPDGGSMVTLANGNTLSGTCGESLYIESPVKEGYAFTGWTPELPKLFPSIDTTYKAQWKQGPEAVKNVVAGYDCKTGKIAVFWTNAASLGIKELLIKCQENEDGEFVPDVLPSDAETWTVSGISADGSIYHVSIIVIDMEGNSSSVQTVNVPAVPYAIGQVIYLLPDESFTAIPSGVAAGIIFAVKNGGMDYTMVALHDASAAKLKWSLNGDYYHYFTNSETDGRVVVQNVKSCCVSGSGITFDQKTYPAMYFCENYSIKQNGIILKSSGWYLPALNELNAIYNNKPILETVLAQESVAGSPFNNDDLYWSATQSYLEKTKSKAWAVNFQDGSNDPGQINIYRTVERYARAVYSSYPVE